MLIWFWLGIKLHKRVRIKGKNKGKTDSDYPDIINPVKFWAITIGLTGGVEILAFFFLLPSFCTHVLGGGGLAVFARFGSVFVGFVGCIFYNKKWAFPYDTWIKYCLSVVAAAISTFGFSIVLGIAIILLIIVVAVLIIVACFAAVGFSIFSLFRSFFEMVKTWFRNIWN